MKTGIFFFALFVTSIVLEIRAFRAGRNRRLMTPLLGTATLGIGFLLVFVIGLFVSLRLGIGGYIVFYGLAACVLYTSATLLLRRLAVTPSRRERL